MAEKKYSPSEERMIELDLEAQERKHERDRAGGRPKSGLPVIVKKNGKYDMGSTVDLSAKNYKDALDEKYNPSESARGRAKKSYNVPAQITEEDRQKGRDEMARAKRERTSNSDISSEDKDALKKLLEMEKGESEREGEEPKRFRKGGMVNKSKRGDGCCVKGRTKGKMY